MSFPAVPSLANAISNAEGYGVGNNIPTVANNPGSLELGDQGYGTINAAGGNKITVFASLEDGMNRLQTMLSNIYSGNSKIYNPNMTLQDFGNTYSGGNTNYGTNLANQLGVSPQTTLAQLNNVSPSTSNVATTNAQNQIPTTGTWSEPPASNPKNASGPGWGDVLKHPVTSTAQLIFSARLVMLVIGLILIAAGLFSFKQTQQVIDAGTRTVKKGAAIGAALAMLLLALFGLVAIAQSLPRAQNTPPNATAQHRRRPPSPPRPTQLAASDGYFVGQVTDTDAQNWNGATWTATLVNASTPPVDKYTGQPVPTTYTGILDANGNFQAANVVHRNDYISPDYTSYSIVICSNTSAPCLPSLSSNIIVNAPPTIIPPFLINAVIAPRFNPGANARGYNDGEVVAPISGSAYYNTINSITRQYNGTTWNNAAASIPGCASDNANGLNCTGAVTSGTTPLANVMVYGATADGIHDDTPAVRAAYAAIANTGGTVYFPKGTYNFASGDPSFNSGLNYYVYLGKNHAHIQCDPGAVINANSATLTLFGVTYPAAGGMQNKPGFLINLMPYPGYSQVTMTTPSDASNFNVGDIVYILGGPSVESNGDGEINWITSSNSTTGVVGLLKPTSKPYSGGRSTAGKTGIVASVTVNTGGTAYTAATTVAFSGSAGTGATAVPVITGGVITAINVTNGGSGYNTVPTVTITDSGGGTGATATAVTQLFATIANVNGTVTTDFSIDGCTANINADFAFFGQVIKGRITNNNVTIGGTGNRGMIMNSYFPMADIEIGHNTYTNVSTANPAGVIIQLADGMRDFYIHDNTWTSSSPLMNPSQGIVNTHISHNNFYVSLPVGTASTQSAITFSTAYNIFLDHNLVSVYQPNGGIFGGILLGQSNGACVYCVVESNIVRLIGGYGTAISTNGASHATISNNYVETNAHVAIGAPGSNIMISGNRVHAIASANFSYGIDSGGVNNVVVGNALIMDGAAPAAIGIRFEPNATGTATGNIINGFGTGFNVNSPNTLSIVGNQCIGVTTTTNGYCNASSTRAGTWAITSSTTAAVTFAPPFLQYAPNCTVSPNASTATTGVPFVTATTVNGFSINVPTSGTIGGTYICTVNNVN